MTSYRADAIARWAAAQCNGTGDAGVPVVLPAEIAEHLPALLRFAAAHRIWHEDEADLRTQDLSIPLDIAERIWGADQ